MTLIMPVFWLMPSSLIAPPPHPQVEQHMWNGPNWEKWEGQITLQMLDLFLERAVVGGDWCWQIGSLLVLISTFLSLYSSAALLFEKSCWKPRLCCRRGKEQVGKTTTAIPCDPQPSDPGVIITNDGVVNTQLTGRLHLFECCKLNYAAGPKFCRRLL